MSMLRNIFIFLGLPGAGKGSLAQRCVDECSWLQISTGNLCRKHIMEQTEIGKAIDLIIKAGKLIDDTTITRMVVQWVIDNADKTVGMIVDGYPRTKSQAVMFAQEMSACLPHVSQKIVFFCVPDDVVVDRLRNRLVCQNKNCQTVYTKKIGLSLFPKKSGICDACGDRLIVREDDNENTIRKRLEVYHKHADELMHFYRDEGQEVIELDATYSPQAMFDDFLKKIHKT